MREGKFSFKSNVGGIDIDFCDSSFLDKYEGLEGSDGNMFKGYDMIDSGLVDWELSIETKDYGITSFHIEIKNIRVAIKDEDDNVLDLNFSRDEYDINHYIETRHAYRHKVFPSSIYVDLDKKSVEVSF